MAELESKTQHDAMNLLRKRNCYVYKNPQNMYTEKGRPDLTVCVPVTLRKLNELYKPDDVIGLYVGIEMKRLKRVNGVSTAQEIVGRTIQKHGGIWFSSNDTQIIKDFLDKLEV